MAVSLTATEISLVNGELNKRNLYFAKNEGMEMKREKVTYKEQLKELQDFVNNDMQKIIESQRKAMQEFEKLVKGNNFSKKSK